MQTDWGDELMRPVGFKGRQVQVHRGNKKGDASDTSTAARRGQQGRIERAYRHYRVEMPPTGGRCARVLFDFLRKMQ